ncbi:hypothetical protein [Methylobacterium sp. R2-1]|uniref:hypothetical protein n=1 Tax=Methylobacterium sp. R2-1 TaxID=2587064 RepID=UPI001616CB86|nr:hypothetical protein [Methylobacterium sp. R2-1]MBB2964642.1 hypothetical protein [Methylobacterium sp. R2-1]
MRSGATTLPKASEQRAMSNVEIAALTVKQDRNMLTGIHGMPIERYGAGAAEISAYPS